MNKAFVREPDDDGRAYCPSCGALGAPVTGGPLATHLRAECRTKVGETGWFCSYPPCEVAYFDQLGGRALVSDLKGPVYPKDPDATLCACFGFQYEEIEADASEPVPQRIRALLAKSQSDDARCQTLAPDGRCCMTEIKRLYLKLRQ